MRPTTYLLDVDGCVVEHMNKGSSRQWDLAFMLILPNVVDWFDAREKEGAKIVLVTARPESLRGELEAWLREYGLYWHALVMGVTGGDRILINDEGKYRNEAITIPRNGNLPSCGQCDTLTE